MWDKLGNVNEMVLANYLKKRIPADRRRRPVQGALRACRARSLGPA